MELLQRQLAAASRPATSDPSAAAASAAELTYLRGRVRDLTVANRALRRQLLRHTAAGAADAAVAAAAATTTSGGGEAVPSAGAVAATAAGEDGSGGEAAGGAGGVEELERLREELVRVRGELEAARGEGERLMELSNEVRAQRDRYAMQLVALLGAAAAQQQQVHEQQAHMQQQQLQPQHLGGGGADYAVHGVAAGGGRHGSPPRAGSPGRAGSPLHRHAGTFKQGPGTAGGQGLQQQQQGWYPQGQQTPGWAPGAGAGPPSAHEYPVLAAGGGLVQRAGLPYGLPYNVIVAGGVPGGAPPGVVALPVGLGVGLGLVGPAAAVQQQAAAAAWLQALVAAASPGRSTLVGPVTAPAEEASALEYGAKDAGGVGSAGREDGADRRSPSPPAVRYASRAGVASSCLLKCIGSS